MSAERLLTKVYFEVFAPDHPSIPKKNWLQWLAVFIAIPNWTNKDITGTYQKQTGFNLFKKFFGWRDQKDQSVGKIIGRILLGVFILAPINLLTVLVQTPISIVKLFTEFLPKLITTLIENKIKSLEERVKNKKWRRHKLDYAAIIGLSLIAQPFYLLHFISRSFTTPIKGFKRALDSGKHFGASIGKFFGIRHPNKIKMFFGVVFAVLSITSTIATWAFALPFALQYAGAFALNYLSQQGIALSANVVFTAIHIGLSAVGNVVATVLSQAPFMGQFIATLAATVPELIGLSAIAGLLTSTIGVPASNAVEAFKKFWYRPPKGELFRADYIASPLSDFSVGGGSLAKIGISVPDFFLSPRSSSNFQESPTAHKQIAKTVVVQGVKNDDEESLESDCESDYSESKSYSLY